MSDPHKTIFQQTNEHKQLLQTLQKQTNKQALPQDCCSEVGEPVYTFKDGTPSLGRTCVHGCYCTPTVYAVDWKQCPIYMRYK
jgi:hypothetical protein